MLRNYLLIAFRNLWRNKMYSVINIGGLALGLTTAVMLLLWVQDELSYDRFHQHGKYMYRVVAHIGTDGSQQTWSGTQGPVASSALREVPGVKQAVRVTQNYDVTLFTYGDKTFTEDKCAYVDPSFFTAFNFPLVQGSLKQPFPDKQSIVLTESTARKYFGETDPVGKVIQIDQKNNFTVSGVIKDIPANSSIQYSVFFPLDILKDKYKPGDHWKSLDSDWGNYFYWNILTLQPGVSPEAVAKKLTAILHRSHQDAASVSYELQPLHHLHLYAADGTENGMQTVRIFSIVAIVVLLIACINYVNLATAQAARRAKEVGVRKVIGAYRQQVFGQFLGESAIVCLVALLAALVMIAALMPVYNDLSGKKLTLDLLSPNLLLLLGGTIAVTLAVAGIYPALLLSSFQPLHILKGKLSLSASKATFRQVLVIMQFSASIILIVSTLVIGGQLAYIRSKQLGYDRENIFSFGMRGDMNKHFQSIRSELLEQSGITGVTRSSDNLLDMGNTTADTDWNGKNPKQTFMIHPMAVEHDFLKTFNIKLVAGRNFTGTKAGSTQFILNETAVREAGIKDPVGKRFKLWDAEGTIIGVVKDFHFKSIHHQIEPAILYYYPDDCQNLYVKTTGRDVARAIAAAESIWKEFNPAFPFKYSFMDESYDQMYKADQRTGKLFNYFTAITILISCLGLFGLATYTAERRVKEIGIRKVLGASVSSIVSLLSREFIRLVLIAFGIAGPVAWYLMHRWLQNFAYKIDMDWRMLAVAGALSLLIALFTVSFQSIKAALANPVKSLRSE